MLSFHPIRNLCLISVALFFLSACAGDSEEPKLDIGVFLSNSSEFLDVIAAELAMRFLLLTPINLSYQSILETY